MKLLLTNDELHEIRGGTQTFTMDLALGLRARAHEVAVFAWMRGSLADELAGAGVPVVASPRECGFLPDVIHGQHHLAAMTAITAFPGVPAIYLCHGYSPWQERPPLHPRILHYAGMAPIMAPWMASLTGRSAEEITVIPNTVHLGRFSRVRRQESTPRRAVVFGNTAIPADHIAVLERACRERGIALDLIGEPFGTATAEPHVILPDYDIVFAIGRSALEALASGCAVVLFGSDGCGPMIHPQNLEFFLQRNLTVPEAGCAPAMEAINREIGTLNPAHCTAIAAEVRARFGHDSTCDLLEALYARTVAEWRDRPRPRPEEESIAISDYLAGLGPHIKGADERFRALRLSREKSRQRVGRLKARLASLQAKWDLVERRLPGVIRRWILRGRG